MREEKALSGEHQTMPEVNFDSSDAERERWLDLLLSMNIRVWRGSYNPNGPEERMILTGDS